MDIIKLLLDVVMIGLLGAGVYFALRLEKQLRVLRTSNAEMAKYTAEFARNIDRAEAGIKSLKQTARTSGDDLEKLLDRAATIREELQFVVDYANCQADKIGALGSGLAAQQARAAEKPPAVVGIPSLRTVGSAAETGEPRSRAERELMQALHSMKERQA